MQLCLALTCRHESPAPHEHHIFMMAVQASCVISHKNSKFLYIYHPYLWRACSKRPLANRSFHDWRPSVSGITGYHRTTYWVVEPGNIVIYALFPVTTYQRRVHCGISMIMISLLALSRGLRFTLIYTHLLMDSLRRSFASRLDNLHLLPS